MMNRWVAGGGAALVLLLTVARGVANPPKSHAQTTALLRVVQAAAAAPRVDLSLNGQVAFSNLAFNTASEYVAVPAARQAVRATVAGQPQQVLFDASVDLQAGQQMTLALVGQPPSIMPLLLVDRTETPASGQASVRLVHAAAGVAPMDVATSGGMPLFKNVAYGGTGTYVDVPAGTYTLNAQLLDQSAAVLTIPNVALTAGQVVTLFVVPAQNATTGLSVLSVVYRGGASTAVPVQMPATGTGGGETSSTRPLLVAALALLMLIGGGIGIWRTARA